MRLAGKVALVTGAASGIGRAMALRFSAEGASVASFDIDAERGGHVFAQIEAMGGRAVFVHGDVSEAGDVQRVVAETVAAFNHLDILVNSAGLLLIGKDVPIVKLDLEVWQRVIAVNLTGTFLACKYSIPAMIQGGGGSIINLASVASFKGWDVTGAYGASKGGVMSLTRDIAIAYAPNNIRANAICPGNVDTEMTSPLAGDPRWQAGIQKTPLKRLATADEIANMAIFLASEEASFVTGAALPVDGGLTAG